MKPECELCKEPREKGISSIFGNEFAEKLVYHLFKHSEDYQKNGLTDLILMKDPAEDLRKNNEEDGKGGCRKRLPRRGADQLDDYYLRQQAAKEKSWEDIVTKVKAGVIQPTDISVGSLVRNFFGIIARELAEEGLIGIKREEHWLCADLQTISPEFNEVSERIIAKRVLKEVLAGLKEYGIGPHEVEAAGFGEQPSHILRDYDDFQHTYDMIDIQETLIQTAIKNPVNLEISLDDLKARLPLHKSKSSFVILMDCSYSMLGAKFIGTIMAAMAFRELLQEWYKDDHIFIFGYNEKPFPVAPAEILRLKPYGYTDIGLSLEFATNTLMKEDGNRVVLLITDGEPTCSSLRGQTPEESALRAAYKAGEREVQLNIIMLDKRPELRRICEKMARLNGNAVVTYVDNPLNLKDIVIKSYLLHKRRRTPFSIQLPCLSF
ncbi:MAG: hypothetical protein QXJ75_05865 [Candidatus Bathyarchaeia archaeon]